MHTIKFLDLECSTSGKKSAEFTKCINSGKDVSYDVNFLRPLHNWQLKAEAFKHAKGSKYTRIFKFPSIDWCLMNAGKKIKFSGFQKMRGGVKKCLAFYHECPFEGLHSCPNVSVSNEVVDMLPLGQYRTIFTGQDKEDSKIYQLNITFSINQ